MHTRWHPKCHPKCTFDDILLAFWMHFGCIPPNFFYNMRRLKINFWCFLEVKIAIFGLRLLDRNDSQINYQNSQFQSNWYKNELLEFLDGQNYQFGERQLGTNNSQINYQNGQFQSNWYKMIFWSSLTVKIAIFGLRQLDTNNSQIN